MLLRERKKQTAKIIAYRYKDSRKPTSRSAAGVTSGCSNTFLASSQGHSSGTCIPPFFFFPSSASASASAFSAALGMGQKKSQYKIRDGWQCKIKVVVIGVLPTLQEILPRLEGKQRNRIQYIPTYFSRKCSTTPARPLCSLISFRADLGPTPLIGSR